MAEPGQFISATTSKPAAGPPSGDVVRRANFIYQEPQAPLLQPSVTALIDIRPLMVGILLLLPL